MRHALFALALLAAPAQAQSLYEAASGLDLFPCDLSALSCTTLTLPLDHLANDPEKTIDITFALSFATVESRGILFYQVGGPLSMLRFLPMEMADPKAGHVLRFS